MMFMRSLSWRKRSETTKDAINESQQKPQSWVDDEKKIKISSCSYNVEYLGYVEVFESRGVVVCEKAIKLLKSQKSRCKRAILYISGDAIRVVDEINKILLVDQTLEKVSFCAPDRNIHEGFAYICRDATTKRWLCHGFLAIKDSGDRMSHALGCAFAVCLERKISRDKLSAINNNNNNNIDNNGKNNNNHNNKNNNNAFKRSHFRQASLLDRITDPQIALIPDPIPDTNNNHANNVSNNSSSNNNDNNNNYNICMKRPRPVSKLYNKQLSLPASCHVNNNNNDNNNISNNKNYNNINNNLNETNHHNSSERMINSSNNSNNNLNNTFQNGTSCNINGDANHRDSNNNLHTNDNYDTYNNNYHSNNNFDSNTNNYNINNNYHNVSNNNHNTNNSGNTTNTPHKYNTSHNTPASTKGLVLSVDVDTVSFNGDLAYHLHHAHLEMNNDNINDNNNNNNKNNNNNNNNINNDNNSDFITNTNIINNKSNNDNINENNNNIYTTDLHANGTFQRQLSDAESWLVGNLESLHLSDTSTGLQVEAPHDNNSNNNNDSNNNVNNSNINIINNNICALSPAGVEEREYSYQQQQQQMMQQLGPHYQQQQQHILQQLFLQQQQQQQQQRHHQQQHSMNLSNPFLDNIEADCFPSTEYPNNRNSLYNDNLIIQENNNINNNLNNNNYYYNSSNQISLAPLTHVKSAPVYHYNPFFF